VQRYEKNLELPNLRGRKGSQLGVVFEYFVQKDHYFDNQAIKQNSGTIC